VNHLAINQLVHVPLQSSSYNIRTFRCGDKSIISTSSTHHRRNGCGKLTKTDHHMKTCQDSADSFLAIICIIATNYDEVRLVFDRYMKTSLKETRTKRTKGKSTYYHVKDTTLIRNISLKDFLSDIKTRAELTEYLANKIVCHNESSNNRLKEFMVSSGTRTKGNVDIPDLLLTHSQEEANTLLMLHAVSVPMKQNLWSVLQTRVSCRNSSIYVSTFASFYSLPHWTGQAEEEHFCL